MNRPRPLSTEVKGTACWVELTGGACAVIGDRPDRCGSWRGRPPCEPVPSECRERNAFGPKVMDTPMRSPGASADSNEIARGDST